MGALAVLAVARLGRPGARLGLLPASIAAVVFIMWILAAATLVSAATQNRMHLLLGATFAVCPFLITFVSAPLFLSFVWILKDLAPTRLRWAGAGAGFAAGIHRCARVYPALSGTHHTVYRHLVSARHVDPRRDRRVPRPVAVALVNPKPTDNQKALSLRYRTMTLSIIRGAILALICIGLEFGSAGNLRAQSSSPRGPAVVELYTSQGCSSCPPADALLGELSQMPNVIALAFHVDYWDSIGWRDHFALPTAVERQHRYVETLGLSSAFTPQVVIDGRSSFVGSDKRRILAAIAEPLNTIPISVEVVRGELTVTVPEGQDRDGYDVNLIAYLPQAVTNVGRGENSGRTLKEFNIVRQFRSLGVWNGRESVFRAPMIPSLLTPHAPRSCCSELNKDRLLEARRSLCAESAMTAVRGALLNTACFRSSTADRHEFSSQPVRLSAANATALAELLRILCCGEESAALTFDHLAGTCNERTLRSALAGIAADEREHLSLLTGLWLSLPPLPEDRSLEATLRRFFQRLADRDALVHFVRIAAIDSATCHILGALRRRGKPLASDLRVNATLERIHHDEARPRRDRQSLRNTSA